VEAGDEQRKINFFFSYCLDDIHQELLRSQSIELGKLDTAEQLFSKIRFVEQTLKSRSKSTDSKTASTRKDTMLKRKRHDSGGKGTQSSNTGSTNNSPSSGGNNSNAGSLHANRGGHGGNHSWGGKSTGNSHKGTWHSKGKDKDADRGESENPKP
jgi:hypothetical protein